MKAIVLCLCLFAVGCQSPSTTVIVPGSVPQVAAILHERFTLEQKPLARSVPEPIRQPDEAGFVIARINGLKMTSTKAGTEIQFLELFPGKMSRLQTTIAIKHHSANSSQITILSERRSADFFGDHVQRREDIEGLRMAQILRWIIPDEPVRFQPYY